MAAPGTINIVTNLKLARVCSSKLAVAVPSLNNTIRAQMVDKRVSGVVYMHINALYTFIGPDQTFVLVKNVWSGPMKGPFSALQLITAACDRSRLRIL